MKGMELETQMQMEEDYWSIVMKKSCAWQTLGSTRRKREWLTYCVGGCKTEIHFVLAGKRNRKYVRDIY